MTWELVDSFKFNQGTLGSLFALSDIVGGNALIWESPWLPSTYNTIHLMSFPIKWSNIGALSTTNGTSISIAWYDNNFTLIGKSALYSYTSKWQLYAWTSSQGYQYAWAGGLSSYSLTYPYNGIMASVLGYADKQVNTILTANSESTTNSKIRDYMRGGINPYFGSLPTSAYAQAASGLTTFGTRTAVKCQVMFERSSSGNQPSTPYLYDAEFGTFIGG